MSDSASVFDSLTDASGNAFALSKSVAGDAASGKVGDVSFAFQDSSGNIILPTLLKDGSIPVSELLSASAQYRAQSISATASELLGASAILVNRKVLGVTPTNGTIYIGFNSSVTTTTGTPIFKNQSVTIAATDTIHVYAVAANAVDCRVYEAK